MENLQNKIKSGEFTAGIVGQGFVGETLAKALIENSGITVYGYDINPARVLDLIKWVENTEYCNYFPTDKPYRLAECDVILVCVPTKVDKHCYPDNKPIVQAMHDIADNMKTDVLIIIESSVEPGTTREFESQLRQLTDKRFYMGFSPERINPGDGEYNISNTTKIISSDNPDVVNIMASFYLHICNNLLRWYNTKEAELSKLIENCQRDVNIAFVNEMMKSMDEAGIDFNNVFELCRSKWNWLPFEPGLVGGDCIPNNAYYTGYYNANSILHISRVINDLIPNFIVNKIMKDIRSGSKLLVIGTGYKPGCNDEVNSTILYMLMDLRRFGVKTIVTNNISGILRQEEKFDAVLFGYGTDEWMYKTAHHKDIHKIFEADGKIKYVYDLQGVVLPHSNLRQGRTIQYWGLR